MYSIKTMGKSSTEVYDLEGTEWLFFTGTHWFERVK